MIFLGTYSMMEHIPSRAAISPQFMEPKGSVPQLQLPTTCPYPEPHQSSPRPPSHFQEIHLNISLLSSKWFLSLRFLYQNPVCTSPVLHSCYVPCPSHSSRFHHPYNITNSFLRSEILLTDCIVFLCFCMNL
jgi:hypothetical protein